MQKIADSPALSEYGMEIIYEDPTERVDMYINWKKGIVIWIDMWKQCSNEHCFFVRNFKERASFR